MALMVLAQAQHRARTQDTTAPLKELASLHPRNGMLGVDGFAQWADGPPRLDPAPGSMHELLRSLDLGFATGYLARVQRHGLGSALPTQDAALPANLRLQLANRLAVRLVVANCQGGSTMSVSASGYKLDAAMDCRQLRAGNTLNAVEGVPIVEQPAKAWQAAAQACAQGGCCASALRMASRPPRTAPTRPWCRRCRRW